MSISDRRRPPLPARLTCAERDFYLELRRLVNAAGMSCRALEEATSSARSETEEPCFYSKSQWARWLNGVSPPPRRAIRKLAEHLARDDIRAEHLVDIWEGAFTPAVPADPADVGPSSRRPRPRQLPNSAQRFIGRTAALKQLAHLAGQIGDSDGPVVIVIEGTAGVGKTTLANHFAHSVSGQFPDGQLYVNLRGFHHAQEPMSSAEALSMFLDALGVAPESFRASADDLAALYRSVLAGQRVLVVIDNAHDADQVRELLPGGRDCLVLVTSRSRLAGLITEGAHVLRLDPFTQEEARELLDRRLGTDRVERELPAADELIRLCAHLPLALSVAAAHAAANPFFPLGVLADDLRSSGLDGFDTGDPATSARTILARSCKYLTDQAVLMFCRLGIYPGPDVSIATAASLCAVSLSQARKDLNELARANLVEEYQPRRFTFHDLLRAYASEEAYAREGREPLRAAIHRVLDHFLHSAMQAYVRFTPHRPPLDLAPPLPGVIPVCLDDSAQALAWYESEAPGLIVLINHAYERGFDAYAWRMAWTLTQYFRRRGRLQDWAATQRVAVAAAERLGDRQGMAHSHYQLAHAEDILGDQEASELHARQALALFSEMEDLSNEAIVLNGLAFNLGQQGRYEEALPLAARGIEIVHTIGFRAAQAALEETVGQLYSNTGDYSDALAHCELAQALHRDCGNHAGVADTLVTVGHIFQRSGDLSGAREQFRHAMEMYQNSGDLFGEADALIALGDSFAVDRPPAARQPGSMLRRSWNACPIRLPIRSGPNSRGQRLSRQAGRIGGVDALDGTAHRSAPPCWAW